MATAKFKGLNVEAFEAWLTALESGEIPQGHSSLHQVRGGTPSMCCLGVVSHVHADACKLEIEHKEYDVNFTEVIYDGQSAYLPTKVAKFLGLPESHIEWHHEGACNIMVSLTVGESEKFGGSHYLGEKVTVSRLNDSGLFDFKDIARILRREFLNSEETANA